MPLNQPQQVVHRVQSLDAQQAIAPERPKIAVPENKTVAALKSPTVLSTQVATLILLASLWLPVGEGCKGSVITPASMVHFDPAQSFVDWFFNWTVLTAFTNGLWIAGVITLAAIWKSKRIWQVGFTLQLVLTCLYLLLMTAFGAWEIESVKSAVEWMAFSVPVLTISVLWVGWSIQHRQWVIAWARLQHLWTFTAFVYFHLGLLFSKALFYGYFIVLAGLLGTVVAVEIAKNRMEFDLWDRSRPIGRFNFSIRSLMGWTTFLAVIIGYYQGIPVLLEQIFGSE